ncbi:MAG: hypothetical protein C0600_03275 [Ignavibacteria bacterium]|nr:MAG: hypothetical protein C0600_03275 [Ignavibacteria bacterium]
MNSDRPQYIACLLGVLLITGIVFSACDSPLDIETPRNQYVEQVSVLPGKDIGTAVSVVFPVDTTGGDSSWTPAHFSMALVFDASGSISTQMKEYFISAGNTFLDSLDGMADEGTVVFFTQDATVYQHTTTDVQSLRTAVNSLTPTGATAMWDGIYLATLELQSKSTHVRKAVVVITDSDDNASDQGTPSAIIDLGVRSDIKVFTISMRGGSHELSLRNIALGTGGRHYPQPSLAQLNGIMKAIAAQLRAP